MIRAVTGGDAVGHSVPNDGSREVRCRLQHVVNGRGWPGEGPGSGPQAAGQEVVHVMTSHFSGGLDFPGGGE